MNSTINRETLTPMMQQYMTIKEAHPNTLVLFRLGDFYELFFDDAITASQTLGIVLTARDAGQQKAPMCGVPYHSVDKYIEPLIDAGFHVAICEQTDEIDTATKIVKRVVTSIVTPGTFTGYSSDDARFIAAYYPPQFVYANVATGDVFVETVDTVNVASSLATLAIRELIVSETESLTLDGISIARIPVTPTTVYPGFDEALGLLYGYCKQNKLRDLSHFKSPKRLRQEDAMTLDASTIAQLELFESSYQKTKQGSLRYVLDHTKTAMGRRLLSQWLARPSRNQTELEARLALVETFVASIHYTSDTRHLLEAVYDIDRLVGKVHLRTASPKDIKQLEASLLALPKLQTLLSPIKEVASYTGSFSKLTSLTDLLAKALVEIPPLSSKEGGIFQLGYDNTLDELMTIHQSVQTRLQTLEQQEQERTGIKKLKIGFNKPFGYYIEVTKGQLNNLDASRYTRKQTLVNAERFITEELKAIETDLFTAEERRVSLEATLFEELLHKVSSYKELLQEAATGVATLDVIANFAYVAETNRYVKPTFGHECRIVQGRHPVIESLIPRFVANDTTLNATTNMVLITGPNMSGKSTYIRQVALIAILAQIGSFVPAVSATLPLFDAIYTRIGASDDVLHGQSTFMVEMREVYQALAHATANSLLIFDEIGRGTATFDGVAIAQATLEYIAQRIKAFTLFSTHYHELTTLEHTLGTLQNIHVSAEEQKGDLVFHYHVLPGAVDKSYGIHVAKLAKLPAPLVKRANDILRTLESRGVQEVTLFAQPTSDTLRDRLAGINLDDVSPKDALALLYQWKTDDE
jgi:DNA mismatch repair protein MutS